MGRRGNLRHVTWPWPGTALPPAPRTSKWQREGWSPRPPVSKASSGPAGEGVERNPTLTHQWPSTGLGPPGLSSPSRRGLRSEEGGALGGGGETGPVVYEMATVTQGIQQSCNTVPCTAHCHQIRRTVSFEHPHGQARRLWLGEVESVAHRDPTAKRQH